MATLSILVILVVCVIYARMTRLEERERFFGLLRTVPFLAPVPSKANYILFDAGGTGKRGKDMVAYAESKGLIFRPESEKFGSDGWFRITIGSKEENRMAVDVVREFLTS